MRACAQLRISFDENPWIEAKDGDPTGFSLYRRHYSAAKNKSPKIRQFVGPGEHVVLLTADARALFVWRRFIDDSGQQGINCAVFRNEGPMLSSDLIRAAVPFAIRRWGPQRLYTYINTEAIRHKRDPGRCFLRAGWRREGNTKRGLLILARLAEP